MRTTWFPFHVTFDTAPHTHFVVLLIQESFQKPTPLKTWLVWPSRIKNPTCFERKSVNDNPSDLNFFNCLGNCSLWLLYINWIWLCFEVNRTLNPLCTVLMTFISLQCYKNNKTENLNLHCFRGRIDSTRKLSKQCSLTVLGSTRNW